ncbi:uncharacterized protein [Phyllobates terribilis]|uniref:uncharacterized protein n=1 Tax=Phyllobates terribilis TaxID=111132 RepID=UPI003CCAE0AF
MDVDQLQKSIRNFTLDDGPRGNQGYSQVLLQIFGYCGHGKSSFINSCKYVVDDGEDFTAQAQAAGNDEPMTMERKAYDLTKNITMVDNRGCSTMSSFQRAEIYAQLGNFLPIGEKVKWMENYKDLMARLEDAELNPNYSDFIVPILIHSATSKLTDDDHEALKEFIKNCVKITGVKPIVVITKKNSGNFMEAEKAIKLMGAEVVISVENYTEKDHIKTRGRTRDILTILHNALEDVKYRLSQERNPRRDWRERKKFLLEYIHEAEMKKKENEIRREKEKRREEEKNREKERNPGGVRVPLSMLLLHHLHKEEMEMRRAEARRREEEDSRCLIM